MGIIEGAFGLIGAAFLVSAFMLNRSFIIRVEEAGLSVSIAQVQVPFTWDAIQSVTLVTRKGVPLNYQIRGKAGKLIASWRTNIPAAPRTEADAQPVSGDELAALVSARSSVPVETREQR